MSYSLEKDNTIQSSEEINLVYVLVKVNYLEVY